MRGAAPISPGLPPGGNGGGKVPPRGLRTASAVVRRRLFAAARERGERDRALGRALEEEEREAGVEHVGRVVRGPGVPRAVLVLAIENLLAHLVVPHVLAHALDV